MNIVEEAASVCSAAEKSLRELMQKAIAAAEYRHLPTLARMAEQLATLATRASQTAETTPDAGPAAETVQKPASRRGRGKARSTVAGIRRKAVAQPRVRSSKAGYPRFLRTDDTLIKVGWSKKSRSEYEHRAPRHAVDAVMNGVARAGEKGAIFTVEALLPVRDPRDDTDVPSYQVYLAIAWLRTEGVLRQHGRDGYSLLVGENHEKTVEERWSALPEGTKAREVTQ